MLHEYKMDVQYEDVDICEVVYHPNYIKFLDRARNKFYEDMGYSFNEQFIDRVGFAIVNINANYFHYIKNNEAILIKTSIKKYSSKTIIFNHKILSSTSATLYHESDVVVVFVDLDKKISIPFNDKVNNLIKKGIG
jgi:acyl-CoA thioester hydrolase